MKAYDRVRLMSDKYIADGAKKGDIGYIIEDWTSAIHEVEFCDPKTGIDFAMLAIPDEDLELAE